MLAVGTSREIPGLLFVFFLKGCSASEARQAVGTNGVWVTCEPEGLSTPLWCGQASYPYGGTCTALDSPGIGVGGRGEGLDDCLLLNTCRLLFFLFQVAEIYRISYRI